MAFETAYIYWLYAQNYAWQLHFLLQLCIGLL